MTMTDQTNEIPGHRRQIVEAAQRKWIRQLIDLSRRNTLLYFKDWKLASAELTDWDQDALQQLLSGQPIPLVDLLPEDRDLARRAAPELEGSVFTESGLEEGGAELSAKQLGLLPKLQACAFRRNGSGVPEFWISVSRRPRSGRRQVLNPLNHHLLVDVVRVVCHDRRDG